jgi:hypothetical protein
MIDITTPITGIGIALIVVCFVFAAYQEFRK